MEEKCDLERDETLTSEASQQEKIRSRVRNPENDPLENDLVETIHYFASSLAYGKGPPWPPHEQSNDYHCQPNQ
jgi:hypothetical protein